MIKKYYVSSLEILSPLFFDLVGCWSLSGFETGSVSRSFSSRHVKSSDAAASSVYKLLFFNARSLCNKIHLFNSYVNQIDPDFIVVTETWAHSLLSDSVFAIKGYHLFRKDRFDRRGGGVIIYVRSSFQAILSDQLFQIEQDVLFCKVRVDQTSVLLGAIYRPPRCDQTSHGIIDLLKRASTIFTAYDYVFLAGDFNYPEINWKSFRWPHSADDFMDFVLESSLSQIITSPTRGSNILDLFFTQSPESVIGVSINEPLGDSDHAMIVSDLSLMGRKPQHFSIPQSFNWSKADWVSYQMELERQNWHDFYSSTDVNEILNLILNSIWCACKASIPLKCYRTHLQRPLWETAAVRAAKRKRREAERNHRFFPTDASRVLRNRTANHLKQTIRNAVIAFEKRIAENSDAKVFWKYVRSKHRFHAPVGPLLNPSNGQYTDDPKECANLIAESYSKIFTIENEILPVVTETTKTSLTTVLFHPALLQRCLKRMRNLSSPGLDGITYLLLKRGGLFLLQQLSVFFQYCLDNCKTPEQWKMASIIPIFKKGNRSSPENYRPVSLTSCMSKLMEACVREVIWNFWLFNKVIRKSQFGFIPESSCCDQLLHFLEDITAITDRGSYIDVIYFDFAKAFNSVPHRRLITKLAAMGIRGNVLGWLKSFIFDRKEVVTILGHSSVPYKMSSGVPQGSVLGPLLFVAFVNDIDANLEHASMLKYADDIKLSLEIKPSDPAFYHSLLQSDVDKIWKWARDWQLTFALNKCRVVHFGRNNPNLPYFLETEQIQISPGVRDLGIFINHDLRWTQHVSKIVKRAEGVLASLNRAFVSRSPDVYIKLFTALVRPHLEFASPVWNPHLVKNIDKLESVQRRVTRRVSRIRHLPYPNRLAELNLDSLKLRRLSSDLTHLYKIVHKLSACNFDHLFKFLSSNTRGHSYKLQLQHSNHDFRKYFFSSRCIEIWNSLPPYIVESKNVKCFKSLLLPEIRKRFTV